MRAAKLWKLLLVAFAGVGALAAGNTARCETGDDIAAWENFIRYYPEDPRANETFWAIVRAASDSDTYEFNRKYADLVDIEAARFDEETGELLLFGPRLNEWDGKLVPPLLVVDDFWVALKTAGRSDEIAVSIGTYNYPTSAEEQAEDERKMQQNVEYFPRSIAATHFGSVMFEADRWLKGISHARDNHTLQPIDVPISGYVSTPKRAYRHFADRVYSGTFRTGLHPYGLHWFEPGSPDVVYNGHSMKIVYYPTLVKYKAMQPDPEIEKFATHMTGAFEQYRREFPVFQELVRLHKLIVIARWYLRSRFPEEAWLTYQPHRVPSEPIMKTRAMESPVGTITRTEGNYIAKYSSAIRGGINFNVPNTYVPASSVPQRFLPLGAPLSPTRVITVPQAPSPFGPAMPGGPPVYGTYVGRPAPTLEGMGPVMNARPTPTAASWVVRIDGRTLKVVAIPMTREAKARWASVASLEHRESHQFARATAREESR